MKNHEQLKKKWLDSGQTLPIIMSTDGKSHWCRVENPTFIPHYFYAESLPRGSKKCGVATYVKLREALMVRL